MLCYTLDGCLLNGWMADTLSKAAQCRADLTRHIYQGQIGNIGRVDCQLDGIWRYTFGGLLEMPICFRLDLISDCNCMREISQNILLKVIQHQDEIDAIIAASLGQWQSSSHGRSNSQPNSLTARVGPELTERR